jgi:hypothetical protein
MKDVLVVVGAAEILAAGGLFWLGDDRLAGVALTMGLWMLGYVLRPSA